MAVLAAVVLGSHAPVRASDGPPYPPAPGCVQGWDTGAGGAFFNSSFGNAMVGSPCRFHATAPGGFRVLGGDEWHVSIERRDGTRRFFSSAAGSPPCMNDVIRRGDRVEVGAQVGIAAGSGIGC